MTSVVVSANIAILGCGRVGSALSRLLESARVPSCPFAVAGALIRDPAKPRDAAPSTELMTDPDALFARDPTVVVELIGGTEPARALVLRALQRRIPVVTANKTLLARCGAELRVAVRQSGTPLLYEAAVLAGVPFLGTFARRPAAAEVTSLAGIVNGTTNFILSRCESDGVDSTAALATAQHLGYAEPDPHNDVAGVDAVEKLAVLLQHFAALDIDPDAIETIGIDGISDTDLALARELGGAIKPVVYADWSAALEAFVAPAFVPASHLLARVDGVENALILGAPRGRLVFQGPGAGPDVTAATVLDDVAEITSGSLSATPPPLLSRAAVVAPETGWLISISGDRLPKGSDVADYLGSYGIYIRQAAARQARGVESQGYLTWPAGRAAVESALTRLDAAAGCKTSRYRALEDAQ